MILPLLGACSQPAPPANAPASVVTWDAPVALDTDYVVPAGTTLSIAPGVTVTLAEGVALLVEGELLARGTAEAPIVFTGDVATPWRSIVFDEEALSATFEGVDVYAEGSIVENAVVEHATRGMELVGASPYLNRITFRANELPLTIDPIGGAALLVRDGATPRVRDCHFEGNVANTFAFGGAVYVHHADPILQDNVFVGNTSSYGSAVATDWMASPIVGSHFEGNSTQSEGGAVSLVSSVSAMLADTVVGNHADTDGGGIHVCVTCNPHAAPYLFDLVVTDNTSEASDPDDGAAGIGAAYLGALQSSDIHGNLRDGRPSEFSWFHPLSERWPAWVADPAVTDVWWGSTDRAQIDAAVWDGADSEGYGVVTLDPIRTAPVTGPLPRAIVSSRKLHYEDAGDDVPVFLTLYNPGPDLAATLTITHAGQPFAGELAYPGAIRDGDVWVIDMPENTVWFTTLDETTYDGATIDDVTWEVTITDAATGVALGVPVRARYLLAPVGAP